MSLFLVDKSLSGLLATYAKLSVLIASTSAAIFAAGKPRTPQHKPPTPNR